MKKLSNITESIWSDIQDRSAGDVVRKEDDINSFCLEYFAEYLYQHYDVAERYKSSYNKKDIITVGDDKTSLTIKSLNIQYKNHSYYIPFGFEELNKRCEISIRDLKLPSRLFDLMGEEFVMTEKDSSWEISISPKNGKVDKKFFISVLDFIIDNAEPPEWSMLKRKDDVI